MKKTIVVFSVIMIIAITAIGCQKTPESPLIIGKSSDDLIDKASEGLGDESVAEKVNAPLQYEADFVSSDGMTAVSVNAAVDVPEASTAPIIRISTGSISQEQADVLLHELVRSKLYDPYSTPSKSSIMKQILIAQQQLFSGPSDEDLRMTHYGKNGEILTWEEWMQQSIAALYQEYNAADDAQDAPISGLFGVDDEGFALIYGEGISLEFGYEGIQLYNGQGLGNSRALYSQNTAPDGFVMSYVTAENITRLDKSISLEDIPQITISQEKAKQLCDSLTEKLNIPFMMHYSTTKEYGGAGGTNPVRCCYVLRYTRDFNGLPITYTSNRGDAITDSGTYNEPWPYETLTYYVNDDGIVGMRWEAPYSILENVTEDSSLIPFSEVEKIFEKMIAVKYANTQSTITIENICFGYARVAEQNRSGSALLVPAWDFFGTISDFNGISRSDYGTSLITINAIDGSIIDRGLGY